MYVDFPDMFGPVRTNRRALSGVELDIVRDEPLLERSVEHGMSPVPHTILSEASTVGRTQRRRCATVANDWRASNAPTERPTRCTAGYVNVDPSQELFPRARFRAPCLLTCVQQFLRDRLEPLGGEPLGLRHGLTSPVMRRDPGEVGPRHLDVVAEDLVVTDLERPDPGPLLLLPFEDLELAQGSLLLGARPVDLGVSPRTKEPSFFFGRRKDVGQRLP